jgi:hypothetical protein
MTTQQLLTLRIAALTAMNADDRAKILALSPDYSRTGIFVLHNCSRCKDGTKPCVQGNARQCAYPIARNA